MATATERAESQNRSGGYEALSTDTDVLTFCKLLAENTIYLSVKVKITKKPLLVLIQDFKVLAEYSLNHKSFYFCMVSK